MSAGNTLEELLSWNDEASNYWKAHSDANPSLLELPCDIGGTTNVQGFVRQIWTVELRWAQRLAGLSVLDRDKAPTGPLDTLFQFHREAMEIFRNLLAASERSGMKYTCWKWIGRRLICGSKHAVRSLRIPSFTASVIGLSWPPWRVRRASPLNSGETSVQPCATLA